MPKFKDQENIKVALWGTHQKKEILIFRIINENGAFIELTNYGASIVSINVPDKDGVLGNVVLGYNEVEGYLNDSFYLGATIGRVANRINNGSFSIGSTKYHLEKNENGNSNHGGFSGFNTKVFDYVINKNSLSFFLVSEDGEGGYPGKINLCVSYYWNDLNELKIHYSASTDKSTVANFTNHAYLNLSSCTENIFNHKLEVKAENVLETNPEYVPTGEIVGAENNKLDGCRIQDVISFDHGTIRGLNHYFIFDKNSSPANLFDCRLFDPASGRAMDVYTSYPGVLVYTGDFLSGGNIGKHGMYYGPFDGICLECQHYPDSPNHPGFPSIILKPDQVYDENIIYKFSVVT